MGKRLDQTIGTFEPDNLINQTYPPADVFHVQLRDGQGALARGTVLARSSGELGDGKLVILGTVAQTQPGQNDEPDLVEVITANCVLAEAVEAGATLGLAYRTGHLNRRALIVREGYTLDKADEEELRKGGILLSDSI